MLRLLRLRAWCLATVLCLAVSTVGVSFDALLHERDAHDACCVPVAEGEHDASAHRYQPAPLPDPHDAPEHCVVCHWARSFRLRSADAPLLVRLDDAGASHPARNIGRALSPALANLPARSPPPLS